MADKILNEEINAQVKEMFDHQLQHHVEIIYFSKREPCETCEDTYQLLGEIASISEKLHLSAYNLDDNPQLAELYNVNLAPGLVILGHESGDLLDYGIRFSGIPSGYEFSSLIHTIILVSRRDSGLQPEVRADLKRLIDPVNLKVFVTPT
jgi:alkyl hydroperoxide reductase subunit AhpF